MRYVEYSANLMINGYAIQKIRVGQYCQEKHGSYLNDQIILDLVQLLDGKFYPQDSTTNL